MEQSFQNFDAAWQEVGGHLAQAIREVATDLGGQEFAASVGEAAETEGQLPNPEALRLLQDHYPGAADRVIARMSEIGDEERQGNRLRRCGRAVIAGFASIGEGLTTITEGMAGMHFIPRHNRREDDR